MNIYIFSPQTAVINDNKYFYIPSIYRLPAGSRSQLQCLTLSLNGEYDLTGHAVNMGNEYMSIYSTIVRIYDDTYV